MFLKYYQHRIFIRLRQNINTVINLEKIFYNGKIAGNTSFDALCISGEKIVDTGYLNALKTQHESAVMIDLHNAFLMPAATEYADLLILSDNPFSSNTQDISKISVLQVYHRGERVY